MILGKRTLPFRYPMGTTIGREHTCCIGGAGTTTEVFIPTGSELMLSSKINKYKLIETVGGMIVERFVFTNGKTWEMGDLNTTVYPFLVRYIDPTNVRHPYLVTIKEGVRKLWEIYGLNHVCQGMFMNEVLYGAISREASSLNNYLLDEMLERFLVNSNLNNFGYFANENGCCCPTSEVDFIDSEIKNVLDVSSTVYYLEDMANSVLMSRAPRFVLDGILEEQFGTVFGNRHEPDKLTSYSKFGELDPKLIRKNRAPQSENGVLTLPEDPDSLVKMDNWHVVDWNGLTNPVFHDLAMYIAGCVFTDFQIRYILQPYKPLETHPNQHAFYLVNRYDQGEYIVGGHAAKKQYEFQTTLPSYVLKWLESIKGQIPPETIQSVLLTKTWDDELFIRLELTNKRQIGYYTDLSLACACSMNLCNIDFDAYFLY